MLIVGLKCRTGVHVLNVTWKRWDAGMHCLQQANNKFLGFRLMVFNATFNNISVISWPSVLFVEETGVPEENQWSLASHSQTLSHNVVLSTPQSYTFILWKLCYGAIVIRLYAEWFPCDNLRCSWHILVIPPATKL